MLNFFIGVLVGLIVMPILLFIQRKRVKPEQEYMQFTNDILYPIVATFRLQDFQLIKELLDCIDKQDTKRIEQIRGITEQVLKELTGGDHNDKE